METAILSLTRALKLTEPVIISFIGGGGKTTLINGLAAELNAQGCRVVVTTTTKIYPPAQGEIIYAAGNSAVLTELLDKLEKGQLVTVGDELLPEGKVRGISPELVEEIFYCSGAFVLVEADGSAGKPVKGHGSFEPVLPPASHFIVPILGLDALGQPLTSKLVHRPEILISALSLVEGSILSSASLSAVMQGMINLSKELVPGAEVVPVFNKTDLLKNPGEQALKLAAEMKGAVAELLLFTVGKEETEVKFAFQRREGEYRADISCVILAAGSASRMGRDKLTLEFQDSSVLETTLTNAAAAGFQQVIVVVQPDSPWISRLTPYKSCSVVTNPRFNEGGMSSSLITGLLSVDSRAQGTVFALGDQPLILPSVYLKIAEAYQASLPLVAYPSYQGKRGNPVIFDRRLWPELLKLQGDKGGRELIAGLTVGDQGVVEVDTPHILLDLDTPEDYKLALTKEKGEWAAK